MQLCVSHDWVKKIPFTKALLQMSVVDQFRRNWAFPLGFLKLHIFYTWPVWKCVPSDLSLDTSSESAYKHTHTNYFAYSIKKKKLSNMRHFMQTELLLPTSSSSVLLLFDGCDPSSSDSSDSSWEGKFKQTRNLFHKNFTNRIALLLPFNIRHLQNRGFQNNIRVIQNYITNLQISI